MDTGQLPLPDFTFDGIDVSASSDGELAANFVRFRRESDGGFKFEANAEIDFVAAMDAIDPTNLTDLLPECEPHKLALTIDNTTVTGSFEGDFCVLPSSVSLNYNSASACQFSGGDKDGVYTFYFGEGCAGVKLGPLCIYGFLSLVRTCLLACQNEGRSGNCDRAGLLQFRGVRSVNPDE